MNTAYATALMRAWVKRRTNKGITVTADDMWRRICEKWPGTDERQREQIFQAVH